MFHVRRRPLLMLLLLAAVAGCERGGSPQTSPAATANHPKDAAEIQSGESDRDEDLVDVSIPAETDVAGSQATAAGPFDGMPPEPLEPEESAELNPEQAPTPKRLMVLLAGGPLLVDLYLSIDGKAWSDSKRSASAAAPGPYSGRTGRSLLLDSSRSRYYEPRWHSRAWQLLEADRDGALSAEEWHAAPARLLARDADDDRILYPHDLDSLRDQVRSAEGLATAMRSEAGLHAARLVSDDADWHLISAILSDFYASGQPLRQDSFPLFAGLFAELDADESGRLKSTELAAIATRKAHVTLNADFAMSADSAGVDAGLQIVEIDDDLVRVDHASTARIALTVGYEGVDISIHDRTELDAMAAGAAMDQAATRDTLRIWAHNRGDSVFAHLDTDHDGRLGEREIAHALDRLQSLDTNGDGRLNAGEVAGRMAVALVRGNLPAGEARYNLPSPPPLADGLDPPDWFVQGDFNGDGDVSRREFVGTLEQFSQLDLNENGFISAKEAAVVEVH